MRDSEKTTTPIRRRELLGVLGTGATAATVGLAGCSAFGRDSTDGYGGFQAALSDLDFGDAVERRSASFDAWSLDDRLSVPESDVGSSAAWLDSTSVQTAPWTPPSGWEDTAAGELDTLRIMNYGDTRFDPATAAVDALFERETGITVERLEVPMEQAIPKAAAFLSAGDSEPHLLQATVSSSMSTYAGAGWLEPVDPLMPEGAWDEYLPLCERTYQWNGSLWGGPGTVEGVPVNVRPDLLEEQGLDAELTKIREGTWTWDDLETIMAAFEGTDVYGYGFRGGSDVDAERDWRMLYYQTGGHYVGDDGRVEVDRGGGGLAALEKLIEWRENGWLPDDTVGWGESELTDGFVSGQLALAPIATDVVGDALDAFEGGSEYVIARPPRATEGPNPRHATYGGGPVSAINAHAPTAHKLAGTIFQDCRFSVAASWWEYVHEGNMAPAKVTYEQADEHDLVFMSGVRGQVMEDAINEVFRRQRELTRTISQELQQAYAGEKSAADALEAAQDHVDVVLGQN